MRLIKRINALLGFVMFSFSISSGLGKDWSSSSVYLCLSIITVGTNYFLRSKASEMDLALYNEVKSIIPFHPVIQSLKEQDFKEKYDKQKTEALKHFVREFASSQKKLSVKSVQQELTQLYKSVDHLIRLINQYASIDKSGRQGLLASGEPLPQEDPRWTRYKSVVDELNRQADLVVEQYDAFTKEAKRKLLS